MNKRIIALTLTTILGAAANAAPAPVADLSSASTENRLAVLERMFNTRTDAQHRMQSQLDLLQNEVNELRGSIETHNYQLEKILERQRELYLEIDKRIEAVMIQSPESAADTDPSGNVQTSLNEDQAYDKAVNLILKDKRYDEAIPEFEMFLQNYPNSNYVSNAHYWLGQLLFNKQDWAGATNQFEALINGFPDSTKRADAMLKLGIAEQQRANIARAEQLWKNVIVEYPKSSARKLAEMKLKDLR
ncbi:MAG: tol-pal system protein YbgF [Paraglaciecola sp.]|jgi:tol-pal system protein YbgF